MQGEQGIPSFLEQSRILPDTMGEAAIKPSASPQTDSNAEEK